MQFNLGKRFTDAPVSSAASTLKGPSQRTHCEGHPPTRINPRFQAHAAASTWRHPHGRLFRPDAPPRRTVPRFRL